MHTAYLCLPRTMLTIRHLRPLPWAPGKAPGCWCPSNWMESSGLSCFIWFSWVIPIVPYILSHKYCAIQNAMSSSQETKYTVYEYRTILYMFENTVSIQFNRTINCRIISKNRTCYEVRSSTMNGCIYSKPLWEYGTGMGQSTWTGESVHFWMFSSRSTWRFHRNGGTPK